MWRQPKRASGLHAALLSGMIVLGTAALTGCLADDPPLTGTQVQGASETTPNESATTHLESTWGGLLVSRWGGGEFPFSYWQGDAPGFCFKVPDNTTGLTGHLTWSPPQQMGLEFHAPNDERTTSWDGNILTAFTKVTPPIELTLDSPPAGTWYTYAGPGAAGGPVEWELTLTWDVARGNATLEETVYDGEPCH